MATSEKQGIGAPETTPNGTVISDGLRRRRRLMSLLTEHEHAFHAIVRTKVPGFGHVLIENMKNFGRNLAEDPNDEGFKAATESTIEVTSVTAPSTGAAIKADNATHMDDIMGVARGTTASTGTCSDGCTVQGEARDENNEPVSAQQDSEDVKSLYTGVDVEVLNGTINWPASTSCTEVAGYDDPIPKRANIDTDMTNAEDPNATPTTSRRLGEMSMIERSLVDLDDRVAAALGQKSRKLRRFRSKRNNKVRNFWNEVKRRARAKGKEIAEEKIKQWMSEWVANNAVWTNRNSFSYRPSEYHCRRAYDEIVRLVNHYDWYINGPLNKIDTYGNMVLDYIADVKETYEDLKKVSTVLLILRIPVAGMGFLPYVGPAFRVFGNLMARLQQVLDRCKNVARRIVETIDRSRIEPNVQTLVDKAGELQIYLNTGTYTSEAYILGSIVIASSVCPSTAARPCNYVWDKLQHFNNLLDRLRNVLNHLANLIMQLYNGLKAFAYLYANAIWRAVVNFFSAIYNALRPFIDLLNRRICVRVPIPVIRHKHVCVTIWYPCGVRKCRRCARIYCGPRCGGCGWRGCRCWSAYCNACVWYPCGVNFCHRRGCSWIPYPAVEMRNYCFTILQIIKGVLNLLSIVMNAFMSLIKRLIPGLPNIRFNIPGFPFSMPHLPTISIPWDLLHLPNINLCGFSRSGAHSHNMAHSICGIVLPRCR